MCGHIADWADAMNGCRVQKVLNFLVSYMGRIVMTPSAKSGVGGGIKGRAYEHMDIK